MKRRLIVLAMLLAVSQPSHAQTAQQQQQLKLLNQLDQMDKLDLLDRLDEAKACANKEDFTCAAEKIKAAKLLIVDGADTKAIADAQAYVNARIVARDERLRREAEARARAEAEARARAAAQANSTSASSDSWRVINISDRGWDNSNNLQVYAVQGQKGSQSLTDKVMVKRSGQDIEVFNGAGQKCTIYGQGPNTRNCYDGNRGRYDSVGKVADAVQWVALRYFEAH